MIQIKNHILPLLLTLLSLSSFAVDKAPKINRVCLDLSDSTATIYWESVTDICGSFTGYDIYGRADKFSIFSLLASVGNINTNNVSVKLPNIKRWQFYIVVNKACNGIDSFHSDTIFLDNEEPTQWQLDSVSVDMASQKVIAGWSKHDTVDVEGYHLYHVTGVGASNVFIGDEKGNSFLGTNEDPTTGKVTYLISAYDSCSNASPLSDSSTTIFLTKTIDTCTNTLFYSWSRYIGWPSIASYSLVVSINNAPYQTVNTLPGSNTNTSYVYKPGDQICALIRATHGTNTKITSSSNIVCQSTNALIKPAHLYIRKVTVENHNTIGIYSIQDELSIDSLSLQKSNNNSNWSEVQSFRPVTSNLYYQDLTVNVNKETAYYKLIAFNSCGQPIDTSNTSKNILLSLNTTDLNWNGYTSFEGGVSYYNIVSSTNSSTWNIEETINENNPGSNYSNTVQELVDVDGNAKCFCVYSVENGPNKHGLSDTSFSNQVCAKGDLIVFVPNAFAPKGHNTTFAPYIRNANPSTYTLNIYNRWGEQIYNTSNLTDSWDGTYNGVVCQMGPYTYTLHIKGNDGKSINKSGIINLIR